MIKKSHWGWRVFASFAFVFAFAHSMVWAQEGSSEDGLVVNEEMLMNEVVTDDAVTNSVKTDLGSDITKEFDEGAGAAVIEEEKGVPPVKAAPSEVPQKAEVNEVSSIEEQPAGGVVEDFAIESEPVQPAVTDLEPSEDETVSEPEVMTKGPVLTDKEVDQFIDENVGDVSNLVIEEPAEESPEQAMVQPEKTVPAPAVRSSRPIGKTPVASKSVSVAPLKKAVSSSSSVRSADKKTESVIIAEDMEVLRRQAEEAHARESLKEAEKVLLAKDYQKAIALFNESLQYIGNRIETQTDRNLASEGLAESYYQWAVDLRKIVDLQKASEKAKLALSYGHPKAAKLVTSIDADIKKGATPPVVAPPRRWQTEDYKKAHKTIADMLKTGKEYMATAEYEKAINEFELVLKQDPNNTEAIRLRDKASQKKYDVSSFELESTRRDMMQEVRKSWNPRDYGLLQDTRGKSGEGGKGEETKRESTERARILDKMKKIKIPEVEFRMANINDVVAMLQSYSVEFDETEESDDKKGVNIILHLGGGATSEAASGGGESDVFGSTENKEAGAASQNAAADIPLITFNARYISLLEALEIVASVADLRWKIRGSVVMIVPKNAPIEPIVNRMYDVLPSIITRVTTTQETGERQDDFIGLEAKRTTEPPKWKEFFIKLGVPFPDGSSIDYVSAIGKLVVANTADNLAILEEILAAMNVVPNQIEIEARFVEVAQTDFDALGFQWLMTDDWEIAQKKGQENVPLGSRQRIKMSANSADGGFTMGNRFVKDIEMGAEGIPVADGIFKLASVLTNPELSMVLHMLEQQGNADLLSAPKVTTRSGAEATIKVVEEYIYPTEFEVTEVTGRDALGNATVVGGIVEPGSFETREVGVILQVTPEVSTETAGSMIDLVLSPQVVTEPKWKNYGSVYTDVNGNPQQLNMEQPFFYTREIMTQLSIYNGATVVMGGMINEKRTSVDDKIPFLGDLPLIGRLFRSTYDKSDKRNLLIFVTARLVDPAGRPVGVKVKSALETAQQNQDNNK